MAKTSDLFVLHARRPAFIARVNPIDEKGKITLELIEVYQEAEQEVLDKILKQMGEWYYSTHLRNNNQLEC